MLDIKYRVTYGDSDRLEIIENWQNIGTRIVLKFSFALYSSKYDPNCWKKYQFWLKHVSSFRKQLIGILESFLKSNFDLNEGYKTIQFRTFKGTDLLYIYIKIG